LRVWERRYGFPQPVRDAAGDRLYPGDQVDRLKLISRLLDAGLRPGKVVGLDSAALSAQIAQLAPPPKATVAVAARNAVAAERVPSLEALLDLVGTHDPQALRHALTHAQLCLGLVSFVTDVVAPLTTAVGEAWARGRFEVFEEHLFTEVITGVLRHAIASLVPAPSASGPRVLLTTLPQELHGLGLLMAEAVLTLEGCTCISLGTQTPTGDIVQAAQAHRADVVALSFTNVQNGMVVLANLRELRARLPPATEIWVGGSCSALYQHAIDGVTAVQPLTGLPAVVADWCRSA
jgi:methanogenic corrinoid protein MtbC1